MRDFSSRRNARIEPGRMNRLYAAESSPSLTGAMADHRLVMRAAEVEGVAREIAKRLGVNASTAGDIGAKHGPWLHAVARDLQKNRGAGIVIAGEHQSAMVHALAHAMNGALGNAHSTVIYTDAVEARPEPQSESLKALEAEMNSGKVEALFIFGGNPVYGGSISFADSLRRVAFRAHLSLYEDETSYLCHWHVPEAHWLESWGDARAFDGTVTIQQPLITPLYGGKSALEVLSALGGRPGVSSYDIVRNYWKTRIPAMEFEKTWRRTVHDGVMAGTALPSKRIALSREFTATAAEPYKPEPLKGLEVNFRADPTVYDGRFANNGWLQELPKPLTKLTWDNAALLSPRTAEKLGVRNEDVVLLKYEGRGVRAPIWILPGHADDSVTLPLGYGRTHAGRVGNGAGFNAFALRRADAPWSCSGLEVSATGEKYQLAQTQNHHSMEGRHPVREGTAGQFEKDPEFIHDHKQFPLGHQPPKELTLYPEDHKYTGYAWGMAVDLTACTGCNACVTACQAENNIPIVGKTQVRNAREMHWIRVDRYFEGPVDSPRTVHQPVPCMHCENAPCEVVCPVAATVHSDEGLNDMVYNRCVGTRYCSNNCPYKVRRFNFLAYNDEETPVLKLLRNPDVTVRMRGVMEKCTYCVQRINAARITAEREGRGIRDGEIVTACQQACPAQAIVFGDINDAKSEVSRLKASRLNYGLLADLNTRPRTTYLAKLRNPNPEIGG
jgi:molybdopterin-containing oxidoreductase family iron-sulfur binding subunit